MCLFFILTVSMALAGCMEHGLIARARDAGPGPDVQTPDTGTPDAATDGLRFTDVVCEPDVLNGEPVATESFLDCTFRVVGVAGRETQLSCEDPSGVELDCHNDWPPRWLDPEDPTPLPIEDGWFGMGIGGPNGPPNGVVWVAHDGVSEARFELSWTVKVNNPPDLWVECGGNGSGFVTVAAGDLLQCVVHTTDPDPGDEVHWQVVLAQGRPPEIDPAPLWGEGPGATPWAWQTELIEAGESLIYRFYAHDSSVGAPHYDLMVSVQ